MIGLGSRHERDDFPSVIHHHKVSRDARFRRLVREMASERGRSRARREAPPGFEDAPVPRATYRVQLNAGFTFRDATKLVPYLARLGVSHIYCSPYLKARQGSTHGYDIIDHNELNPEIGSREDFAHFVAEICELLGLEPTVLTAWIT